MQFHLMHLLHLIFHFLLNLLNLKLMYDFHVKLIFKILYVILMNVHVFNVLYTYVILHHHIIKIMHHQNYQLITLLIN